MTASSEIGKINPTLGELAKMFVERSANQAFKGKKRDDMALEFFAGAASALMAVGHEDAQCVLNTTALLIAFKGYREIEKLAGQYIREWEPVEGQDRESYSDTQDRESYSDDD